MRKISLFVVLLLSISCNNRIEPTLFESIKSSKSGISFKNIVTSSSDLNVFKYRNFYNGGGVGIGDINNDGLNDVYLTSNMGSNKLFLNLGNFQFKDITDDSGTGGNAPWSTGVSMVDINADGLLDIYVSNAGIQGAESRFNELFINNGDNTFTESAGIFGLAESGITTHASFFDFDNDGDLDVYLLNNSFIPVSALGYNNKREIDEDQWSVSTEYMGGGDRLLRNDKGYFVDVTEDSGIFNSLIGFGLGITIGDINKDGFIDLFISNDFYERDYLYINQHDGTFKEEGLKWMNHSSHSSMGADMADLNNDGYSEIFVTDMLPKEHERLMNLTDYEGYDVYALKQKLEFGHQFMQNALHWNNRNSTLSEIAYHSGVAATDWSWGALLFDMDLDGYRDIFVANGIFHDLTDLDFMNYFANDALKGLIQGTKKESIMDIINKMPSTPIPNYAFKNLKGSGKFTDSWKSDFSTPSFSNGAAYGDLDNDGDYDLVINNLNQDVSVYKNLSMEKGANSISLKLKGGNQNKMAIGSKITTYANNQIVDFTELIPFRGFQSSSDYTSIIAIPSDLKIDSIVVDWDNKMQSIIIDPKPNIRYEISYENAEEKSPNESAPELNPLFAKLNDDIDMRHKENHFIDYNYEITAPEMLSREGPGIAVGDVDNDGKSDIFLGNSFGYESMLFTQNLEGGFQILKEDFIDLVNLEVTAAEFIDFDNDGDLDLYIGTGGNQSNMPVDYYFDRIYENIGEGRFLPNNDALPPIPTNTSVVAPQDYDQDGDIDLFIGNKSLNGIYGVTPKSLILENLGNGKFSNATNKHSKDLEKAGMISDAKWIDFNNNGVSDLVVTGSWMSPLIFINNNGILQKTVSNLEGLSGWWNSIIEGDFNNDGRLDFILGNKGDNNFLFDPKQKLVLRINDFDANGTLDPILSKSQIRDLPIHTKNELQSQLVQIKKQLPSYTQYAKSELRDILPIDKLQSSIIKEIQSLNSIVVLQTETDLNFEIKQLPSEIQRNSVNTGVVQDINGDSFMDVILFGGQDHFKPQFSKNDAGYGEVLLGNGTGEFNWIPYDASGFKIKGVVRDVRMLGYKNQNVIALFKNDEEAEFYVKNNE